MFYILNTIVYLFFGRFGGILVSKLPSNLSQTLLRGHCLVNVSWPSVRVFGILSRLEQMDQADIIDTTSFEGLPLHQAQINLFKVVLKTFQSSVEYQKL